MFDVRLYSSSDIVFVNNARTSSWIFSGEYFFSGQGEFKPYDRVIFYRTCMSSYQLPKTKAHFDSCIRLAFLNSFVAEMKRAFMLGNLLGSRKMRVPFLKVSR